ncbi:hypothetical protein OVA29_16740 [Exiguobacterium sp. SL14]|nr:hypothetical protein [Exiguobacterium sp. SL14]MCY1692060.1 hypothetical protein [Exiguobacterium sp. SL14]
MILQKKIEPHRILGLTFSKA